MNWNKCDIFENGTCDSNSKYDKLVDVLMTF